MPNRGVYFLASDSVYECTLAFLSSFRLKNPKLPLCLIPFSPECDRVRRLAKGFDFSVFDDSDALEWCDRVGHGFHGRRVGHYRKLSMWAGGFEEFIYIDVDTIILQPLNELYDLLHEFDFVTASSNHPDAIRYVWCAPPTSILSEEAIAFSANTGFIISKRRSLNMGYLQRKISEAMSIRGYMSLSCMEQPLLNYLIVESGLRYTSLRALAQGAKEPHLPQEVWGADVLDSETVDELMARLNVYPLMIHWAGLARGGACKSNSIWKSFRALGQQHKGRPGS